MTSEHGLRSVVQDNLVWVHLDQKVYLKVCFNVDDIMVISKGSAADDYYNHLCKRWKVKRMGLDGWLGKQFYPNPDMQTVTITMDVRLAEYMKKHLPEEMQRR